jgi:hypothetical protein
LLYLAAEEQGSILEYFERHRFGIDMISLVARPEIEDVSLPHAPEHSAPEGDPEYLPGEATPKGLPSKWPADSSD